MQHVCQLCSGLNKRRFTPCLTPGLVHQCPDRLNLHPPPALPLALILLAPPSPPSSFILCFSTDPTPQLSPQTSLDLLLLLLLISSSDYPFVFRTPRPAGFPPPPTFLYPLSFPPPHHHHPPHPLHLSDPHQLSPGALQAQPAGVTPLKIVGGSVCGDVKAKQYHVIPLLK